MLVKRNRHLCGDEVLKDLLNFLDVGDNAFLDGIVHVEKMVLIDGLVTNVGVLLVHAD